MTPELPVLAAKLRRLREHLGMSRPAFAELLGIPPTTLKNYENGYREAIPASVIGRWTASPPSRLTPRLRKKDWTSVEGI